MGRHVIVKPSPHVLAVRAPARSILPRFGVYIRRFHRTLSGSRNECCALQSIPIAAKPEAEPFGVLVLPDRLRRCLQAKLKLSSGFDCFGLMLYFSRIRKIMSSNWCLAR